jgi:hypothetical protein
MSASPLPKNRREHEHERDAVPQWLTFDEVVVRLRFTSRRALFAHLRRHPAPVYQRAGAMRYFMRADDVDAMMVPVSLVKVKSASKPTAVPPTFIGPRRPRGRPRKVRP